MPGKTADGHTVQPEAADGVVADERADHEDVAVGEVDQLDDAVDHRVAQGDQRVDEAQLQAADALIWSKQSRVVEERRGPG